MNPVTDQSVSTTEAVGIPKRKSPWMFVPSLSFAQAVPATIMINVTALIYKSLGLENDMIGLTSLFLLPLSFKFLFAPLIDSFSTKRKWSLYLQAALFLCFAAAGVVMVSPGNSIVMSVIALGAISIIGSFADVPSDGIYVEALSNKEQALFVGVRTAAVRVGGILLTGFLVMIAGLYGEKAGVRAGWAVYFGLVAFLLMVLWLWHIYSIPHLPPAEKKASGAFYLEPFKAFYQQNNAMMIIGLILLYRLGEGFISKMGPPFLIDSLEKGGLGLSVAEVGFMYGTVGAVLMTTGGLLGGWVIQKYMSIRTIVVIAICMTFSHACYVYLAYFQPISRIKLDFSWLGGVVGSGKGLSMSMNLYAQMCIMVECFAYGMGYSAFLYYLCRVSARSSYKASFFAVCLGLQTFGWMMSCTASGYMQYYCGYTNMFIWSILLGVPGIVLFAILLRRDKGALSSD